MNRIGWCTRTWNPVTGCTPISEGCQHCWAKRMASRLAGRYGYPEDNPFNVTVHPDRLTEPSSWRASQRVFVISMGDLFHELVPIKFFSDIMNVILQNPHHTFMLLTKRPENMHKLLSERAPDWKMALRYEYEIPLNNLWLGVTVENQKRANERIPILLDIPAKIHFVSVEPMLEQVELDRWFCQLPHDRHAMHLTSLDWVICGAETGAGARPCETSWIQNLADRCKRLYVPFYDKKNELGMNLQEIPQCQ